MLRRLRSALLIALAAVIGALAGRLAAEMRRRAEAGEPPKGALGEVSLNPRTLSPRELVPGIVAAVRVRDVPWSYLHIPSWFAALSVNFGAAALARELEQLGELTRGGGRGGQVWEPGGWERAEVGVEVRDATDETPPASASAAGGMDAPTNGASSPPYAPPPHTPPPASPAGDAG